MNIPSIQAPAEPRAPASLLEGYATDAPSTVLDPNAGPYDCKTPTTDGRLSSQLRAIAQLRDGNEILKRVAQAVANGTQGADVITAMTQLAVTGSNAYAAYSQNPIDLTAYLKSLGQSDAAAASASAQIMQDFNDAENAVRNPLAGVNYASLRQNLKHNWIAVSGEDDSPDFPVNVSIAPYPQFHQAVTVNGITVNMRYIVANQQGPNIVNGEPVIPQGNDVIVYIHGEGSKAEEACDFIPALFASAPAGRSFTVIAFDQPSCGYSTMIPHLSVAPMPPPQQVIATKPYPGSPILDFVYQAIINLIETLVDRFNISIRAIMGGSLGGHMALRFATSGQSWLKRVVAWSPASVQDHDVNLLLFSLSQSVLTDPQLETRSEAGPRPEPTTGSGSREDFFNVVWCQNTFDASDFDMGAVAAALIASNLAAPVLGTAILIDALTQLQTVPPQPTLWYRDDWGAKESNGFGTAKNAYMANSRFDRREVYCTEFRQWHWRICEEMLNYTFDASRINKPLLLMVGESDNYPMVHFFDNVKAFAQSYNGEGYALSLQDTGHSIHNERPTFLAAQLAWITRPTSLRSAMSTAKVTTNAVSALVRSKGLAWPPPPSISLSSLLGPINIDTPCPLG